MTVLENVIILLPELVSLGSKTLAPPPVERPRMPDVEGASERGRRDARGHSKTARYDDGEKEPKAFIIHQDLITAGIIKEDRNVRVDCSCSSIYFARPQISKKANLLRTTARLLFGCP